VLTVKTAHGNVDVKLEQTAPHLIGMIASAGFGSEAGARVITEVPEGSKDHVALSSGSERLPKTSPSQH